METGWDIKQGDQGQYCWEGEIHTDLKELQMLVKRITERETTQCTEQPEQHTDSGIHMTRFRAFRDLSG